MSQEEQVAVDKSVIGTPTGTSKVVIERGPLSIFARSVKDENPIYQDPRVAKKAGFDDIPAPPTYAFSAMTFWGTFPEIQPDDATKGRNVTMEIMGGLMAKGGLILHGEQAFEYHRPLVAGDMLVGEGKIVDLYEKDSKGKTMTFLVTENVFRDEKTGDPVVTTRMNLIHRS
jgi:acyl dehydratase